MREDEGNDEGGVAVGQKVSCMVRQVRQQRPRHVVAKLLGPDSCIFLAEKHASKTTTSASKDHCVAANTQTEHWHELVCVPKKVHFSRDSGLKLC